MLKTSRSGIYNTTESDLISFLTVSISLALDHDVACPSFFVVSCLLSSNYFKLQVSIILFPCLVFLDINGYNSFPFYMIFVGSNQYKHGT